MSRLCIDASSTSLGWVMDTGSFSFTHSHGVLKLRGDIEDRVAEAYDKLSQLIALEKPGQVWVEGPVPTRQLSDLAQARVGGAIILACRHAQVPWFEGPKPTTCKKALANHGRADKLMMLRAAAKWFGYETDELNFVVKSGKWLALAVTTHEVAYTEDEADAPSVALAVRELPEHAVLPQ